jgi:hypothetical protein
VKAAETENKVRETTDGCKEEVKSESKRAKKAINHPDPLCPLCQTHGDCMDPSLPDHQFIGEILCSPTICGETAST